MSTEGVIKFNLQFHLAKPLSEEIIKDINAWRRIFFMLELIGQQPGRYGGFGFGNISKRLPPYDSGINQRAFLVSGTQTGGLTQLTSHHYTKVLQYDPVANSVVAEGPVRPSSEALTHGMLYDQDDDLRCVIHGHSPHIWANRSSLGLPVTDDAAEYGSPELAMEVQRLFRDSVAQKHSVIIMGGHEDGVLAFGTSLDEAGGALVRTLATALQI